MSVRHGFLLSVICLLYSANCCPYVFELNEQFAKGNISQLAVTKIDLNGYKTDVSTFQAQDWKDFVMEFCICIREWKVVPRVLGNEELLELTPAVNRSLFKSAWNFLGMERNHHENISFVLFRAWHRTIDSGLFTRWRKLRYSKTRIAYYSNYMATQALSFSDDVEKNPGPSKGKAASTNNNLSRSKPTAARCDHCQKTIRWNQKNISCANCMGCFHLKCAYLKSTVNNWLCNRCTWAALPFYKCSDAEMLNEACFSDPDLDSDNITVTDQGENGTTPKTSTGPDLLNAARQKNAKGMLLCQQHSEQI